MKRDYYTYAEIMLSLRKYYQETYDILNKMHDIVEVSGEDVGLSHIELVLGHINRKEKYINSAVHLLATRIPKVYSKRRIPLRNRADFILCDREDRLSFEYFYRYLSSYFKPDVTITDRKEFEKLFNQLKELPLYNIDESYTVLSPYQRLSLDGNNIGLNNGRNHDINLSYQVLNDDIRISYYKTEINESFAKELLSTKIPAFMLPKEIVVLLESNNRIIDKTIIDGNLDSSCALSIEDEGNTLVLVKK